MNARYLFGIAAGVCFIATVLVMALFAHVKIEIMDRRTGSIAEVNTILFTPTASDFIDRHAANELSYTMSRFAKFLKANNIVIDRDAAINKFDVVPFSMGLFGFHPGSSLPKNENDSRLPNALAHLFETDPLFSAQFEKSFLKNEITKEQIFILTTFSDIHHVKIYSKSVKGLNWILPFTE